MMRLLCACAALLCSFVLFGCSGDARDSAPSPGAASAAAAAPDFVNANCPIMGKAVQAKVAASDWRGRKVGYCCAGCQDKFEALSESEQLVKLRAVGADV